MVPKDFMIRQLTEVLLLTCSKTRYHKQQYVPIGSVHMILFIDLKDLLA